MTEPTARARDGRLLVPQAHGGALAFFPPGTTATPWKRNRRIVLDLLNAVTPEAVGRLVDLVRSPDERVALIAVTQLLDRTLGKASETPQGGEDGGGVIDLTKLSSAERDEMGACLATIRKLRELAVSRGEANGRAVDVETGDGRAEVAST